MQQIMRALCRCWKPAWQGMVMAELAYRGGNGKPSGYRVAAKEGRLVRVSAEDAGSGECMRLILMPPRSGAQAARGASGEPGKRWRTFSAEEVRTFSAALGDHNIIHQGPRPIVSGFQMAEALSRDFPAASFTLRFQAPLYAGEEVRLVQEENEIRGYAGRLCFVRRSHGT